MSYVGHKSRMFRDSGDVPEIIRKRSEGRLKTYPSETDARSWCVYSDDRRQHILDLIRADHEKCTLGKYVPIEVLIDTLLANKNADIAKLRQQVEELQRLLDMYEKLDLTEDQKRMLAGMKREMNRAGEELEGLAERSSTKTKSPRGGIGSEGGAEGLEVGGGGAIAGQGVGTEGAAGAVGYRDKLGIADRSAYEGEELEGEGEMDEDSAAPGSKCAAKKREAAEREAAAREAAEREAAETDETIQQKISYQSSPFRAAPGAGMSLDGYSEDDLKALVIEKDAEIIALKNALAAKEAECEQQNKIARTAIEQLETLKDIMEERDSLKKQLEDSLHELETLRSRVQDPCVQEIAALEEEIERLRVNGQLSPDDEAEVIRKEVDVLKKYCAKLSSIQEENNRLKAQIGRLLELSGIPSGYEDEPVDTNDPDELKDRLKDLKRKFAKFNEIMEERDKLKLRVQQLETELMKYGDLPEEIEMYKRRSQLLDDVLSERDNLQKRLENVIGMEEELKALKKKAARADELERELDRLNGEIGNVRRSSAAEVQNLKSMKDDASRETESVKAERDMLRMKAADMATVEEELERLRYRAKEAEVLRIERDRLKVRLDELAAIEVEFMQLLDKTRCLETIKAEREMYKTKYEELLGLECECDMLKAQVERFKQLDKEREALLRQVRDCECCIADQEDEIKRLVGHIDRLSQGSSQQQDRMQRALSDMRAELEKKNSLIATSEEQLAGVQDQLKTTIAGVSCETSCLRARIEELESELEEVTAKLHKKQNEIDDLKGKLGQKDGLIHSLNADRKKSAELQKEVASRDELLSSLQKELQKSKSDNEKLQSMASAAAVAAASTVDGDEHFKAMLKDSKCAVRKVAEELGKHYQEWDCMQGRLTDEDMQEYQDIFEKYSQERRSSSKLLTDVQALQDRIRQLEQELAEANATIAKLREELGGSDRLKAENKALRRHSSEVQEVAKEQIEELVDHLKKANERIAELEAQNAALMGKGEPSPTGNDCEELKRQLQDVELERNKMQKLVQQLQEDQAKGAPDVGVLRADMLNLEEQLQREVKLRQAAEDALREAEERIANLNKQLNSLTDQIQEKTRRASISESERDAELLRLKAESQQLKENMKVISDGAARRSIQIEGELGVISEQNKQLLKDKVALESENASLLQQIADLKQQLESLRTAAGDTSELDALREEKAALLSQIENQKKDINDMIGKLNVPSPASNLNNEDLERERREKEELQNMIKNLQGQITSLEQQPAAPVPSESVGSSALNDAIAKLTAQLEAEQAKATAAEDALKKLQGDMGAAAAEDNEIAALKERIKELESENDRLKEENARLKASVSGDESALINELANLKQKIKDMESAQPSQESDELNARRKELESEKFQPSQGPQELTARAKELESEKSQPSQAPGELNAKVNDLETEKSQPSQEPDDFNARRKELETEKSALLKETDDLKRRIKELEEENAKLKQAIAELEAQNEELTEAAAGGDDVLLKQMKELRQKIKDLEVEKMELSGKLSRRESEVSGLKRMSKDMEDEHNAEIKRLSKSYQEKLKRSSQSAKMLEDAMNLSAEDQATLQKMKQIYEDQIADLKRELTAKEKECADTIASLKAQHDREIKNVHNKYNDGIAKLQGSHEEVLKDVSKEHEKEIESLRGELRASITTSDQKRAKKLCLCVKTVQNVNIKPASKASADTLTKPPGPKGVCTCGTGFQAILQKILKDGMESLSFDELQMIHTKTCDATSALLGKRKGGSRRASPPPSPPALMPQEDSPVHKDADKAMLMKRIDSLESDLVRKQKQAQQKVGALQAAVRMERQRLEELKKTLEAEKQRNCELMCKIGAQTRAVANMQLERDMMRKQSSFHEEKLQELMVNCDEEKERVKHLEEELHRAKMKQRRDAEALETMRFKLEKSINSEMMLKMQLEQRTKGRSSPRACSCQRQLALTDQPQSPPKESATMSHATSFYTELTVQDVKKKRNFVHHCCMKQRDRPSDSAEKSPGCCCSGQPACAKKSSENDD